MKKVLIIDDVTSVLLNVGQMLELEGYTVSVAENGTKGITLAQAELPDLVICDIAMPDLDGFDVLKALRQNPRTNVLPVIMITGMRDREIVTRIMNAGAHAYLPKPFTRDELLGTINSVLVGI